MPLISLKDVWGISCVAELSLRVKARFQLYTLTNPLLHNGTVRAPDVSAQIIRILLSPAGILLQVIVRTGDRQRKKSQPTIKLCKRAFKLIDPLSWSLSKRRKQYSTTWHWAMTSNSGSIFKNKLPSNIAKAQAQRYEVITATKINKTKSDVFNHALQYI